MFERLLLIYQICFGVMISIYSLHIHKNINRIICGMLLPHVLVHAELVLGGVSKVTLLICPFSLKTFA